MKSYPGYSAVGRQYLGINGGQLAVMAFNRYLAPNAAAYGGVYADNDGVKRWADYALDNSPFTGTLLINPMKANTDTYRPIVLDRPFRSVGELGYVFRDMPWKSLDFFSANSADMTLLDLFDSADHPSVVAGKLSWNVPYPEIWKSLLVGADRAYGASNPLTLSASDAETLAQAVYSQFEGSEKPPVCRSDVVKGLVNTTVTADSGAWPAFKHHREGIVRQIAEVGQSSTLNLLMDLVVEEGKTVEVSPSKTKFIAGGRVHYWVSLAIDRLTYKIIDIEVEEVLP